MKEALWREITEKYRAEIESGRMAAGERVPTSTALAEICGVSRLTAHKALDELQRLGLVTRDGRRGTVVTHRKPPTTGRIALILDQVDHAQNFPRPELLGGIHSGLGEDFSLLICDSKAKVGREIELLRKMAEECDGILCWPTGDHQTSAVLNELANRGIPLVLLDRIPEGVKANAVVSDSVDSTRHALEFLIERGHRRIAVFTFDKAEVSTVVERVGTYEAIMAAHGLAAPELIRRFPVALEVNERGLFRQSVYDSLFTVVRSPDPATAILCVQDLFGVAALECAAEMGLSLPQDLEIATFNDWPPNWLRRPWDAHRIAFQPDEMGRVAIASLRVQIEGTVREPQIHLIPAKFIPAASSLAPAIDTNPRLTKEG